eukprot:6800852-Prymnesium_polylepis.2
MARPSLRSCCGTATNPLSPPVRAPIVTCRASATAAAARTARSAPSRRSPPRYRAASAAAAPTCTSRRTSRCHK